MADFHRIDEGAVDDDWSVSTALLQDLDDQARAAWETKLRGACWSFDARNPPRACGLEEVGLPLLWRLSYGCATLRVRLYLEVAVADVAVSLRVRPARDLGRPITETAATTTTLSTGAAFVDLALTVKDLAPYTWQPEPSARELLLVVGFRSAQGTAAKIVRKGALTVDGHCEGWDRFSISFDAESNAGPATGIPHGAIELRRYDVGAAAYLDVADLPPRRQAIRCWNTGGTYRTYVWPGFDSEGSALNTTTAPGYIDEAWWIPLGYATLYSVEVSELTAAALPPRAYTLNAGQYPSAAVARRAYATAHRVFRRSNVYRLGLMRDMEADGAGVQNDASAPAVAEVGGWFQGTLTTTPTGKAPLHQTGFVLRTDECSFDGEVDPGTWRDFALAKVFSWSDFEDLDGSAATHRLGVEALALVAMSSFRESLKHELRARLYSYTTTPVEGETALSEVENSALVWGSPLDDPAGHLMSMLDASGTNASQSQLRLHALRGLYPLRVWDGFRFELVRLAVQLDAASTQHVALQLQASLYPVGGGDPATQARRFLHVGAFLALEAESADPARMGA